MKNLTAVILNAFIIFPALVSHVFASEVSLKGYASIVAGRTLDAVDPATETERLTNIYALDYQNKFSFKNESLFAVQADADLGDGLTATVLLYQDGSDDYNSEAFNAYIGYQVNDRLRVNAGRIPWPLFQYTDFLDVAYTYPWISPPAGVYDIAGANYLDGITGIYFMPVGRWDLTLQMHSNLDNINGMKAILSNSWISFNTVFVLNDSNTVRGIPPYEDAAASLEAEGYTQQADDLLVDGDKGKFFSVGFNIDYQNWLAIGEYAQIEFDPSWFSDFYTHYLMLGRRFGDFTVHVTYDHQREEPQLEALNGVPPTQFVDFFGRQAPVSLIESVLRGRAQTYKNWIYGVRYDFHHSAAIKLEYLQNNTKDGDNKTLGGIKKFDQDLVRVAIDLVF